MARIEEQSDIGAVKGSGEIVNDAGKSGLVEIVAQRHLEAYAPERVRNVLRVVARIGQRGRVGVLRISDHQRDAALSQRLRRRQAAYDAEHGSQTPSHCILLSFIKTNGKPAMSNVLQ